MATKVWEIDPSHSEVHFKVKHMMVSTVTGSFDKFTGSVKSNEKDFDRAELEFTAEINSINTRSSDRDDHLKSDDFFNAEEFPQLQFRSSFVKKTSDNTYKVLGVLTIRDISKEIVLDVVHEGTTVDPYGNTKAGFEIKSEISRKDFNLRWNAVTEAGSIIVSDEVRLALNVQLVEK